MANDQNTNVTFKILINDRVWKNFKPECSSSACRWRNEIGMLNQELGNTLKFIEKVNRYHCASFLTIKIYRFSNIALRTGVERVGQTLSLAYNK